ncbi:MAG: hypothetical protein ACM31H_03790 [Nitrososphaerales archaeon]
MKKFLLPTGSFTLIFILLPITSANVMLISGVKSNNTIFVNNTNLDISDLIYDIDSRPFNVSYAD